MSNIKIVVTLPIVLGLGILAAVLLFNSSKTEEPQGGNGGETQPQNQGPSKEGATPKEDKPKAGAPADTPTPPTAPKPPKTEIKRRRLEPEATKRLTTSPQKISVVLETSGRAENAKWGFGGMGSFLLTYYVDCDARILSKDETPGGEIKVVEERTFNKCRQVLRVSDTDIKFRLYETLPLAETFTVVKAVGAVLSAIPQTLIAGGTVVTASTALDAYLKKIDGTSAREWLDLFGIKIPETVEMQINKFVTDRVENILKTVAIEGKSYHITYYQDKESGSPLRVNFTYADGSEIATEEEFLVLRRANAFMDSQVVPDKNCSPGDSWTIDTSDFESLLDPYVDGAYCGQVSVERLDNDKSGNWRIGLKPCDVFVKSDTGRTTGTLHLKGGEASVDADNVFVKAMQVVGNGRMKNLTTHHLLFNSRFEGDCTFRGVLTTEALTKKARK